MAMVKSAMARDKTAFLGVGYPAIIVGFGKIRVNINGFGITKEWLDQNYAAYKNHYRCPGIHLRFAHIQKMYLKRMLLLKPILMNNS